MCLRAKGSRSRLRLCAELRETKPLSQKTATEEINSRLYRQYKNTVSSCCVDAYFTRKTSVFVELWRVTLHAQRMRTISLHPRLLLDGIGTTKHADRSLSYTCLLSLGRLPIFRPHPSKTCCTLSVEYVTLHSRRQTRSSAAIFFFWSCDKRTTGLPAWLRALAPCTQEFFSHPLRILDFA